MKAVVLGICSDATLVDISHDVPAHDVIFAALELAAVYRLFPAGTIFLVVVDPGVGSARRGIAVEAGDYKFVGPDNGVFGPVFAETPPKRAVELTERRYARPTVSRTFEGRDRFAPAAGWLAKGIQLTALGRPVSGLQILEVPAPLVSADAIEGEILRVDRFGNLVSNIDRRSVEKLVHGGTIDIRVGDKAIARLVPTYAAIGEGEAAALFGSTDHLEIAVRSGNAADQLDLGRGAKVRIARV